MPEQLLWAKHGNPHCLVEKWSLAESHASPSHGFQFEFWRTERVSILPARDHILLRLLLKELMNTTAA